MAADIVWSAVFWIHVLPESDGMSSTIRPCAIVTGNTINFHKSCQLEFGEYVQTHESGDDNIINEHTSSGIDHRSTGNFQGIWKFLIFASGQKIVHQKWNTLPIPNEVTDCVHALTHSNSRRIIFFSRNYKPLSHDDVSNESDDETYLPSDTDDSKHDYPSKNDEHGGNAAPPIRENAPTGV